MDKMLLKLINMAIEEYEISNLLDFLKIWVIYLKFKMFIKIFKIFIIDIFKYLANYQNS